MKINWGTERGWKTSRIYRGLKTQSDSPGRWCPESSRRLAWRTRRSTWWTPRTTPACTLLVLTSSIPAVSSFFLHLKVTVKACLNTNNKNTKYFCTSGKTSHAAVCAQCALVQRTSCCSVRQFKTEDLSARITSQRFQNGTPALGSRTRAYSVIKHSKHFHKTFKQNYFL